jgi:hypothetical protein
MAFRKHLHRSAVHGMLFVAIIFVGVGDGNAENADLPALEGPITGPGPLFVPDIELGQSTPAAAVGYVYEEFFVSGNSQGKSYKVRMFVIRPGDLKRFSGQVLVESAHFDSRPWVWSYTRIYDLPRGHAAVVLSTMAQNNPALRQFNEARYRDLHLTDEQLSDVFAQVGYLLKSEKTPLPGIQALYATGFSLAAGPIGRYMETHHPKYRLPGGGPIYNGFFIPPSRNVTARGALPDLDVPTMQMNSQLEVESTYIERKTDYRKPDSDDPGKQFRLYEVPGMAHLDSRYTPPTAGDAVNHPGIDEPCALPRNRYPYGRVVSTAFHHMVRWVRDGVPPPRSKRISVIGGVGGRIELDAHGNAMGGWRHTAVDVPFATYRASGNTATPYTGPNPQQCLVYGSQTAFSYEKLADLYPTRQDYVHRVNARLDELVRDGWLLSEYAEEFRAEAARFDRVPIGR